MGSVRAIDAGCWALLVVSLLVAFWLRFAAGEWGLPDYFVPDEAIFTAEAWEEAQSRPPEWSDFVYPHLHKRTMSALEGVASALGGREEGTAWEVALGRRTNGLLGVLTVLLTFWVGWMLFGLPAGAIGAAFLAVAPLPVANAHVNASDGPLVFWVMASFGLAVMASRRAGVSRVGWLVASALVAGLASAVRYPGLAAIVPPLWLCLWRPESVAPPSAGEGPSVFRLNAPSALVGLGAVVAAGWLAGFAIGCPRCLLEWQMCAEAIQSVRVANFELGASAQIPQQGWLSVPYWYQAAAVLPFSLGVVACVLGYVGLASMTRRARRDAALLLAFVLPYFVVIGGSQAVYARYCLPLVPFVCLGVGFWATRELRTTGAYVLTGSLVALALLHSTLFSYQVLSGFRGDTRSEVIRWLDAMSDRRRPLGPPGRRGGQATVGLPSFTRRYDGLAAGIEANHKLREVGVASELEGLRRTWPDFLVVSTPFLLRSLRVEAASDDSYWRDLTSGKLGYTRTRAFEPAFQADGIFAVPDPLLVHAWARGDVGFWIYEPALPRPPR
jgi:hypothetical protein